MQLGVVARAGGSQSSADRARLRAIARIAAGLLVLRGALWLPAEPLWAVADGALAAVALMMDRILGKYAQTAKVVELSAIGLGFLAVAGSALRIHQYQEPCESAVIAAAMLGAAYVLRGDLGFYAFSGTVLFAWLGVSARVMPSEHLLYVTPGLLFALGLSVWMRRSLTEERSSEERVLDIDRKDASERRRITDSLTGSGVGLWYWDLEGNRFSASSHWTELLGLGDDGLQEVNPEVWFGRVHPYYDADLRDVIAQHLNSEGNGDGDHFEYQYRAQHEDGDYRWVQVRGSAIRNEKGGAVAVAGGQVDASHLVDAENRMMQDALHDRLTGLPNRQAFLLRLKRAFEEMGRDPENRFAVIFLDVDHFKAINDNRGHLVGDRLLTVMANRLREAIKSTDIVARFGGDEFVALIENVRVPNRALAIAERFQERLAAPIEIGGDVVSSGVSVGVAIAGPETESPEALLRDADTAMYRAKATRDGQVSLFHDGMHSEARERSRLQSDLTEAVGRDDLMLYFQPVYSAGTGRIIAAEALLRWKRDDVFVPPGEFVPLAEELGLIDVLGDWVLRQACEQAAGWRKDGLTQIRVSVNVSAKQIRSPYFGERLAAILEETGADPTRLELELTESAVLESMESSPGLLDEIREMGVRVSVDDFGAGYAAFGYLRTQDFDTVKIDKCFVSSVGDGGKSDALVRGLVQTAHGLDLRVVAEGVETEEQVRFLRSVGCNALQGFLLGRPAARDEFRDLLTRNERFKEAGESDLAAQAHG